MNPTLLGLNLILQSIALFFILAMAIDLGIAAKANGKILRRISCLFYALAFYFTWRWIGWMELATDFWPGVDLLRHLREYGFIPFIGVIVMTGRLWLSLRK